MATRTAEGRSKIITPDEAKELQAYIQGRLNRQVHSFQLIVKGAGLVLQGRSRTYYAKQLAQHAVMAATDLPILANEIEVS